MEKITLDNFQGLWVRTEKQTKAGIERWMALYRWGMAREEEVRAHWPIWSADFARRQIIAVCGINPVTVERIAKTLGHGDPRVGMKEVERLGAGALFSAARRVGDTEFRKIADRIKEIQSDEELDAEVAKVLARDSEAGRNLRKARRRKDSTDDAGDPREEVNKLRTIVKAVERERDALRVRVKELEEENQVLRSRLHVIEEAISGVRR
jgi:hypothetical protein